MEREDFHDHAYINTTPDVSYEGGGEHGLEGVSLLHAGI